MQRAFSLVELSILLVIFGGLAAASTMLGSKYIEGSEVQTTKQNIDTIEQAIDAYVRLNNRLPCPAPETLNPDDVDFGKEATGLGTCTTATATSGQAMKGVVPFQTLGMGKTMAYDAWGNRLEYYVDKRMTAEDALNTYPPQNAAIGDITVQDLGGGMRTDKAVYAILSSGAKAHGSYNRKGVMQTLSNPGADELENADVDASGTSTGADKVLVQGINGKGGDNKDFDDIVAYKKRNNLATSKVNRVQNCTASPINWSQGAVNCTGSVAELADGTVVQVSDLAPSDTGSVTVACDGGVLTQSNPTCVHVPANCNPQSVNWTVAAACSGTVTGTTLHGASTPTITNSTGGRSGTATYTCNDGTLSENAGSVCGNNCTSGTANWTGTSSCTAPYGTITHAASSTIADATAPGLGNVTMTCTNGSISQSGASCTPAGCGATTLSWGGSCNAAVTAQSHGYSGAVTNATSGYSGNGTATCTDGAWSVASPVCNADCPAQSVNWTVSGQTCSQSVGTMVHGAASSITDGVANSTGNVTVTCNNGTLSQLGASCVTSCPAGTANWTVGADSCSAAVGTLSNGGATSVTDATGTTGVATVTCNNGVYAYSGTTCSSGCPAGTATWTIYDDCSVAAGTSWTAGGQTCTVPSTLFITHGSSSTATDSTAPTTGSASYSCNDGAVAPLGGATCSAPSNCSVAAGTTWTVGANTCTVPTTLTIAHTANGTSTDSTAPTTGSATYNCNNGTATLQGGATCASAPATWVAGAKCVGGIERAFMSMWMDQIRCKAVCNKVNGGCCEYATVYDSTWGFSLPYCRIYEGGTPTTVTLPVGDTSDAILSNGPANQAVCPVGLTSGPSNNYCGNPDIEWVSFFGGMFTNGDNIPVAQEGDYSCKRLCEMANASCCQYSWNVPDTKWCEPVMVRSFFSSGGNVNTYRLCTQN